jgi:membrane-bound lytic murein transglycosylase B
MGRAARLIGGLKAAVWMGLLLGQVHPAVADTLPFDQWLQGVRTEAEQHGIGSGTLDRVLADLEPIDEVIEKDRKQPESRLTFREYNQRVLSEERVRQGRQLLREHRELLDRIAADYAVQPRFIVALWGIESSYGTITGGYPVVGALATLAYEGRRAELFRGELLHALRILDAGDIEVERMTGSWAGAMGQSQFMPSSFQRLAVDYDGDGRRDIWTSLPDVFASIANYLAKAGWDGRHTWGRAVALREAGKVRKVEGLDVVKPLPEWQSLGVRRINGRDLPAVRLDASLLLTDDGAGPAYLVYDNFRVLMTWNRSTYFALTVGELADLISHG